MRILFIGAILLVAVHCDYGPNNDNIEELTCANSSGTWLIAGAYCNGERLAATPFSSITFGEEYFTTFSVGTSDCQTQLLSIVHHVNNGVNLFGQGTYGCFADGVSVSTCTGVQSACNASQSATNIQQNYNSCVVADASTLQLARTVSQADLDNEVTFCSSVSDIEERIYTPALSGPAQLYFPGGVSAQFASRLPGTPSDSIAVTIINIGTTDATDLSPQVMSAPFYFVGGAYPGTGGTCGTVLPGASACQIVLGFTPPASLSYTHTWRITYNSGGGAASRDLILNGSGLPPIAEILFTPNTEIDFGTVTAGGQYQFLLAFENVGTGIAQSFGVLDLSAPFYFSGNQYPGTQGTCTNSIRPGSICTVEIEFRPSGPGIFRDSISFRYFNGVDNRDISIVLTGIAVTAGP